MAGVKGRSGRKKSPSNALREAWDLASIRLPELVNVYLDLAMDGKHPELFEYICDRIMGKPRVQIEGSLNVTSIDNIALIYKQAFLESSHEYELHKSELLLLQKGESIDARKEQNTVQNDEGNSGGSDKTSGWIAIEEAGTGVCSRTVAEGIATEST